MRKLFYTLLLQAILIVVLVFVNANNIYASHAAGADLTYQCLGPNGIGQMLYKLTFTFYRDCGGVSMPTSISISADASACGGGSATATLLADTALFGIEVSNLCAAANLLTECNINPPSAATYPGIRVHRYTGVITLPSVCNNWRLRYTLSARNPADNLATQNQNFSIESFINNSIDPGTGMPYCNSSAVFSNSPYAMFPVNFPVLYNHGAFDADGDSLVFQLINPLGNAYAPINFASNYSAVSPVTTSPPYTFLINSQTGQLQFTPAAQEVDVIAIKVSEYRNGILMGSTIRDMQVSMISDPNFNNLQFPTIANAMNVQGGLLLDSNTIKVCAGSTLQFSIPAATATGNVVLNTAGIITNYLPGASVTNSPGTSTDTLHVVWNTTLADSGCHYLVVEAENDNCPINGTTPRVFNICVSTTTSISALPNNKYCGQPLQLLSITSGPITWSPALGLSDTSVSNPLASPLQDTWYYLTSSCGTDSIFIQSLPAITIIAGTDDTICVGGAVQLNVAIDSAFAPYSIQWIPAATLDNDTGMSVTASPIFSTNYVVTFTAANGCIVSDEVRVNVRPVNIAISASANVYTVHPGDTVNLLVSAGGGSCGPAPVPCTQSPASYQIGSSAFIPSSPTQYPAIYGHFQKSARHQILYTRDELLAQGATPGVITALSFKLVEVLTPNDTIENMTIKMKCVGGNTSTLVAMGNANFTTVFVPKDVAIGNTLGWVTHILDFPYNWDGQSSLLIDICSSNNFNGALNNKVEYSITPTNRILATAGDLPQCSNTATVYLSSRRPNIRFDICNTANDLSNLQWQPATGVNAVSNATIYNPVVTPQTTTTYTVTVNDTNGCVATDDVTITVDTCAWVRLFPVDTIVCAGDTLQLSTQLIYGQNIVNPQYSWTSNPLSIGLAGSAPLAEVYNNTEFSVQLSYGNCISADTIFVETTNCDTVGINEVFDNNSISILPNPAKNTVSILQKGKAHYTAVQVFNALGSLVYEKKEIAITETIDIANWQQGIYLIRLSGNGKLAMGKLLKLD